MIRDLSEMIHYMLNSLIRDSSLSNTNDIYIYIYIYLRVKKENIERRERIQDLRDST